MADDKERRFVPLTAALGGIVAGVMVSGLEIPPQRSGSPEPDTP